MKLTKHEAVIEWNTRRRSCKNKWVAFQCELTSGKILYLKSFNTWVQRAQMYEPGAQEPFRKDGNPSDQKVGEVTKWLLDFIGDAG